MSRRGRDRSAALAARRNAQEVARVKQIHEITKQLRGGALRGLRFGNFITDGTGFSNQPKTDLNPIGSDDPLKYIQASDWQEVIAALLDIQAAIRGWHSPFSGSGVDGAQHFDGTASILGVAPITTAGGVPLTYIYTRDLDLDDGTVIDSGVSVWVKNARLFCRGTLTNNGRIHNDGRPGGESGFTRSGGGATSTLVFAGGNGAGGNGSNTAGAGGAGDASTGAIEIWSNQSTTAPATAGAGHGQGGGGGEGDGGNLGGGGGAVTVATGPLRMDILQMLLAGYAGGVIGGTWTYGSGGGGGGATGIVAQGGGGGAGGNWFFVGADALEGTGTITCGGGRGAAGDAGASPNTSPAGGGGGGGGGVLGVAYQRNPGPNTFAAAGGVGGSGDDGGGAGANGSDGTVVKFNLSGDGS